MTDANGDEARTQLAIERTTLAWWRTGLAALAVALAVGRLLPELSGEKASWPLVTLGLGFAVYACGLFVYGTVRSASSGARPTPGIVVVAASGAVLAVATIVLIAAT